MIHQTRTYLYMHINVFIVQAGAKVVDTKSIAVHRKQVRPICKQGEHESRRLWQHVTNALKHNDIVTATQHKALVRDIV